MRNLLLTIWSNSQEEFRVVLFACFLFAIYLLINILVKSTHGERYSPYFHVLYNEDFKSDQYHALAFGVTVSFALLVAILISYLIQFIFQQFSNNFSYKKFFIYSAIAYIISIILNMLYAKRQLNLPLINKTWWKELGADISKRAHDMEDNSKRSSMV